MQTKSYKNQERQALAANTQLNLTIQNDEQRRENFHGIRFKGRIISDDVTSGFSSGFITVMCLPTSGITVPIIASDTILDDQNEFIIASEPFMVLSVGASGENQNRYGGVYDFDIVLDRTSRTCSKGGRITCQIHNDSGSTNLITVNAMVSLFRTIA